MGKKFTQNFNSLIATGTNMPQIPMLTDNFGIERVNKTAYCSCGNTDANYVITPSQAGKRTHSQHWGWECVMHMIMRTLPWVG